MKRPSPADLNAIILDALERYHSNVFSNFRDFQANKMVNWRYEDLQRESQRIGGLISAQIPAGQPVALLFKNRGLAYASMLASTAGRFIFVPLNSRLPDKRIVQILMDSETPLLLTDDFLLSQALQLQRLLPHINIRSVDSSEKYFPGSSLKKSDRWVVEHEESRAPLYILFTSGSTGRPKGIIISRHSLCLLLLQMKDLFDIYTNDRFTQGFDLSFDPSIGELFLCILSGASIYPFESNELPLLKNYLRSVEPTVWGSTPSTVQFLRKHELLGGEVFPSLRLSLFCGERLPQSVAEYWCQVCPQSEIHNLYGNTETTVHISHYQWRQSDTVSQFGVPIGRSLPASKMELIDEKGEKILGAGIGEVVLSGEQLAIGYLNDDLKTQVSFTEMTWGPGRWYRTGDLAVRNDSGNLEFVGRRDLQVKIRGHRLELAEIEFCVQTLFPSLNCAAFLLKSDELSLAVDADLNEGLVSSLLSSLRLRLPVYAVPSQIFFIGSWPINTSGKADRKLIEDLLFSGQAKKIYQSGT